MRPKGVETRLFRSLFRLFPARLVAVRPFLGNAEASGAAGRLYFSYPAYGGVR